MNKYRKLQATFNTHHNWYARDESKINLSAEQVIQTLETSETNRLLDLPETLSQEQVEREYQGVRMLHRVASRLRGE